MTSPSSSSLITARALILLQLCSRLLTFGLNQALVRLAPPEVFGTAAIQFDLICSTILFLSREGIRNALLRGSPTSDPAADQERKNSGDKPNSGRRLATYPFWVGIAISVVSVSLYLGRIPTSTSTQKDFHVSLALYAVSALVELAIEPHYIAALRSTPPRIRVRVQAEGGMAIVRALVTVGCVVLFERAGMGRPLLSFAIGQITGAIWLAGRYIWSFATQDLIWISLQGTVDPVTTSLALANMRQSLVKHLLTEADRIAVGIICPLEDQGGYAIAMNYGSLVARIIFQPLEETLLLHFSSAPAISSIRLLSLATHLSSHLLLIIPAFLPPLLPALIPFLLPRRYLSTSAPSVLETYLKLYIPLLSLNGILEAYHAATATPAEVKRQIKWMVGSSAGFVAALLVAQKSSTAPEITLIYASCLAVIVRVVYAGLHATNRARTTAQPFISSLLPTSPAFITAGGSGILLRILANTGRWRMGWRGKIELITAGAILGMGTLSVIALIERKQVMSVWKGKAE